MEEKKIDLVNQAPHWTWHPLGIECIDIASRLGYVEGNAFKYLFRAGRKGSAKQDLQKAVWYLKRLKDTDGKNGFELPNGIGLQEFLEPFYPVVRLALAYMHGGKYAVAVQVLEDAIDVLNP